MTRLTFILAAITVLSLQFPRLSAQPPTRLQRTKVQDLSDGLSLEPDQFVEVEDYFKDLDDDVAEQPAETEEIPLGNESAEEPEDAPDDELDDESAEESDEESDESRRNRATRLHLQQLQKSIRDIQLSRGINRTEVPDNQAASLAAAASETLITSSGVVMLPERYTTCIDHRPLYYEDANLERCGNGYGCLQNVCSGVRFFSTTLVLACKMGRQCPDRPVCTLGDCKSCQTFPANTDPAAGFRGNVHGFLSEAAALAGFSLLVL